MTADYGNPMGRIAARPDELAAEVHLATEALLREALDYLLTLPAHPMTAHLAAKLQAHLEDPASRVVRSRAESDALANQAHRQNRDGVLRYTPEGLSALYVAVGAHAAHVTSPAAKTYGSSAQGRKFAQTLTAELASGITVPLPGRPGS